MAAFTELSIPLIRHSYFSTETVVSSCLSRSGPTFLPYLPLFGLDFFHDPRESLSTSHQTPWSLRNFRKSFTWRRKESWFIAS